MSSELQELRAHCAYMQKILHSLYICRVCHNPRPLKLFLSSSHGRHRSIHILCEPCRIQFNQDVKRVIF